MTDITPSDAPHRGFGRLYTADLERVREQARREENEACAREIAALRAENERLREALKTIIDGIPAVRGESYRKDGVISKCDKCPHDRYIYEGCEECVSDFARAALAGGKE